VVDEVKDVELEGNDDQPNLVKANRASSLIPIKSINDEKREKKAGKKIKKLLSKLSSAVLYY
jgi:hypothetical protein